MCQQHPRQIQRQRHTQRQIQRQRQERTSKKKSSCICIAYKLHIIHRRKAEDIVYHSVMTMTTTKTHTKTNTKTKTKTMTKTKCSKDHMLYFWKAGSSRISNMTRPGQTRAEKRRIQSRGPNSRTCVLVTILKLLWLANFLTPTPLCQQCIAMVKLPCPPPMMVSYGHFISFTLWAVIQDVVVCGKSKPYHPIM